MKTALIIGGTRFFGKRLVSSLLERGVKVTLLTRGQASDPFGTRVERIVLDRRKLGANTPALRDRDWDVVYDQVCYEAGEARSAVEAFSERGGRYILTSSISVYACGADLSEKSYDSDSYRWVRDADREQDYAEAKRQTEAVFFQNAEFPVTAVRFPIVLGPDDYTKRLLFHIERVRDGKPIYFPDIQAKVSFIHAQDAANFLQWLGDRPFTGPVNCCAAEPIRLADLIMQIEEAVGKKARIVSSKTEGDDSPFSIESDWFMSTRKMEAAGFRATPLSEWLPGLIRELAQS